jgi:predicted MFS family arabinose efflux permease
LGDTVTPLLAGALLGFLTWRQVISVTLAAGVLVGIIVLRTISRIRRQYIEPVASAAKGVGYLAGLRILAENKNLLILALVSGIRSFTQHGLISFLPLYLVNDVKVPALLVGVYLAVVQVSGMIATPISGTLTDRIGPKRVATTGMLTSSLAVVAFAALDLGSAFVIALALVGFFIYSMRPAIFRWAIGLVPRQYEGTTVGALFTTQAMFSTLMPLVGGILADRFGLIFVFYVIAGGLVVANLITLMVPDLRRPGTAH